jgi:hypothetical protein
MIVNNASFISYCLTAKHDGHAQDKTADQH